MKRFFKTIAAIIGINLCIAVPVAQLVLHASDIQQQQSTLYPFRSMIEFQDDFLTGINSNGNVGYGWGAVGGGTGWTGSIANRYGVVRRDTGAVANTLSRMDIQVVVADLIDPAPPSIIIFAARLVDNDADTQMRIGHMASSGSVVPINGIYFEKGFADTNWFCITRAAAVQTRVDTGVATDTAFHYFRIRRNSSGVVFAIDGVQVCGTMTTNIPTGFLDESMQMTNQVGVSKAYEVDYFQGQYYGITR